MLTASDLNRYADISTICPWHAYKTGRNCMPTAALADDQAACQLQSGAETSTGRDGSRVLWITVGLLGSGQVRLKILETYFTVCRKIYPLIVIQTCPRVLTHPCNVQVITFYFVVHYMHNSRAWCLQGFKFININLTTGRMLFWKFNFGCHHELVISGRLTANGYVDVGSYATVLT